MITTSKSNTYNKGVSHKNLKNRMHWRLLKTHMPLVQRTFISLFTDAKITVYQVYTSSVVLTRDT